MKKKCKLNNAMYVFDRKQHKDPQGTGTFAFIPLIFKMAANMVVFKDL